MPLYTQIFFFFKNVVKGSSVRLHWGEKTHANTRARNDVGSRVHVHAMTQNPWVHAVTVKVISP